MKKIKIGRNAPCPCGSGLKYKKCHGREQSSHIPKSESVDQKLFENLPPYIQRQIIEQETKKKRRKA
jgi:hypothetical protein